MSQKLNAAIAVIGIDIGKNSFHLVGHDHRGAIVLRQKWSRGQVETRLANLPPCLIGMEACVGAHHLSRKLQMLGHAARLPRGSCWSSSGQSIGTATGSSRGSRPQGSAYTTTCWRLRSPTSSPGSPGRFSTRDAPSRASRWRRRRPELLDPRAVLGAVKAQPGSGRARRQDSTTAGLDGPCARRVCAQAGTKERPPGPNQGTARSEERSMT
jgi:hypothetical protein